MGRPRGENVCNLVFNGQKVEGWENGKKCHALKCSGMGVFEVAIFLDGSYFYGNYPNGK